MLCSSSFLLGINIVKRGKELLCVFAIHPLLFSSSRVRTEAISSQHKIDKADLTDWMSYHLTSWESTSLSRSPKRKYIKSVISMELLNRQKWFRFERFNSTSWIAYLYWEWVHFVLSGHCDLKILENVLNWFDFKSVSWKSNQEIAILFEPFQNLKQLHYLNWGGMVQYMLSLWLVYNLILVYLMMLMLNDIIDSVLIRENRG